MLDKDKKDEMLDTIRKSLQAYHEKKDEIKNTENTESTESTVPVEKGNDKNFPISKNKRRNKNRNRNRNKKNLANNEATPNIIPSDMSAILKFKEEYSSVERNRKFLEFLADSTEAGDETFSETDFLREKMKHSNSRVIILEPSVDDIALKKGYKWYFIKPLYVDEYMEFVKDFGPRETKPKEFLKYCLEKCLLLPNLKDEATLPSGTMLTIYRTILDISDFNKMYKIVEV